MSTRTLVDGSPVTEDHREISPDTGMQKDYVVLSEEERHKGFVRPVRLSYTHIGRKLPETLRDLTEEEQERYKDFGYVKYEPYGPEKSPILGTYWTQKKIDEFTNGCGQVTTMARPLAETYAADPKFYSGTFCSHCRQHLPVGENGVFVWTGTDELVGT
jgi:hypothetical protein